MEEKVKEQLDFSKMKSILKVHKKAYLYTLPSVLIATYLFTLFMPRYYSCTVTLAPESDIPLSGGAISNTLSSLGLGSHSLTSSDAITPELYPALLSSNDFLIKLFPETVRTKDGKLVTNYYNYLLNHQKEAWWNTIWGMITEILNPTPFSNFSGTDTICVIAMGKREQDIAKLIKGNISCQVDQKTGAVSIKMTDQDPTICATMANATLKHIQSFIIDYRTNKARNDLNYYTKLNEEALHDYDKARHAYATYADANRNPNLASVKTKMDNLENEMQLKFNIYSQTNNQKQNALHKIQENTPAFTILQSANIPTRPAGPKRTFISLGMMAVVFLGMSVFYLRKNIC